jgi:hypothetical protein
MNPFVHSFIGSKKKYSDEGVCQKNVGVDIESKHLIRRALLWPVLCLAMTISACANLDAAKPEDMVRQRATERWQALVKGEFIRAYSYNAPGFKAVVTADAFRNKFGGAVVWLGAEVVSVNCEDSNKCIAGIKLEFKPALSARKIEPMVNYFDETWLRDEGQWWFFQKI